LNLFLNGRFVDHVSKSDFNFFRLKTDPLGISDLEVSIVLVFSEQEAKMSGQAPIQTISAEVALNESTKFECELCLEMYNLYDKKPFSLVPCGHSICIKCFESLNKTACPYCRAAFTAKIPNWEIIKRLPKPTVPIIFYNIEIKLESLKKTSTEYDKHVVDFYTDLKSRFQKLTENGDTNEISNDSSVATSSKSEADSNRSEFLERLSFLDKKLNSYNDENVEIGVNLKKKVDKFRSDLNQDENKYHEENLRRIKGEIETVNKTILDKIASLKKESERCNAIINANSQTVKTDLEMLRKIEAVIEQEDTVAEDKLTERPSLQYLKSLLSTNVVRPVSSSGADSDDINRPPGYNAESLMCTASQKGNLNFTIFLINKYFLL
jgi:hypothetical protein